MRGGDRSEDPVVLGRVAGPHGVKGWIRVRSWTRPADGIFEYPRWLIGADGDWEERSLEAGGQRGRGLVAKLEGLEDRDAAEALTGADIAVPHQALPPLPPGEYYWSELEGLRVETVQGVSLGVVDRLMETGSNDVLVVKGDRERLIPFVPDRFVAEVDLESGLVRVDWDPEF